jgi:acyl dehydratase
VHLELTLVEKRPSSRPGRGIATERGALVKQDGTVVTSGDHVIVLLARPQNPT